MLFLGYMEYVQRKNGENFWSLYFVDPLSSNNNSFIIENRGDTSQFHYTLYIDSNIILDKDITVPTKDQALITTFDIQNTLPVTITVTKDDEKKELTKK